MRKVVTRTGILVAVVLVVAIAIFAYRSIRDADRDANRVAVPSQPTTPEMLDKAIEAMAAAEDGRYESAVDGWKWLLQRDPQGEELRVNYAATTLKWIEELSGQLASGSITEPGEIDRRKSELARAMAEADRIVGQLATDLGADGRNAYFEAALLEAKSRQLEPPDDLALRKQAADRIVRALQQNLANPLLACKLDDLAQELSVDHADLAKAAASSLLASWQASPRNLYLLVRAGENLLETQDARIVELLDGSLEVAKPMMSMLQLRLAQRNAGDIVNAAKQAIGNGQWAEAQSLRLWFNVLKSSTAFRPDMRLVKPDIMALLGTRFVQRWREQLRPVAAQPQPTVAPLEFEAIAVETGDVIEPAQLGKWYDHDVDGNFELLVARGNRIGLLESPQVAGVLKPPIQELEMPMTIQGMVIADLFEVDSTARPRVAASVEKLMAEKNAGIEPAKLDAVLANRHDTIQEVVVWGETGAAVVTSQPVAAESTRRTLQVITDVPGLSALQRIKIIVPLDFDSDGDLDLVVALSDGMKILQNNGNRTFEDVSRFSSLPEANWNPEDAIACDFDRDLDMDVLCVGKTLPYVGMLENILHSQFRFVALQSEFWQSIAASTEVGIAELDGNGTWDLCALGTVGLHSVFNRTADDGGMTAQGHQLKSIVFATDFELADIDNDGRLDAVVSRTKGLEVHSGLSEDTIVPPQIVIADRPSRGVEIVDCDRDGVQEIFTIVDGRAILLKAKARPAGNYVQARVRGISDVNGGGRINHFSVGSVVELSSGGRFQARVVRDPMVHFGLGGDSPTNLRVVFNNGLTQNVEHVEADTIVHERQELKGSCPFVYGWDGNRFQLITDLLWNAPLGLQIARGKVLPDRPWEHLILPGGSVQPRDGAYELRITEELWEIAYFDHVSLTAVDHPREVDIFSNEKVGPPSIAQPQMFQVTDKVYPTRAVDHRGRDILAKLAKRDTLYAQPFDVQFCQGLCEPHYIELDFGSTSFGKEAKLFLTGWLHPTDTSLNMALEQNESLSAPEPPSLWVPNAEGKFVLANPFIGFPGGKPKTIVVDLAALSSTSDRRVRIAGSQQIYWDEAFITVDQPREPMNTISLLLTDANLHYRGFSRMLPKKSDQPHWYDYEQIETKPKWPPLDGPYTSYGRVAELLREDDDRMVIMGTGDEIVLRFQIPQQAIAVGWTRDFVMHNVGWDKDADVNTLAGQGSMPMPFKSMLSYPAPASQLDEELRVFRMNAPTFVERRSSPEFWRASR